MSLQEVDRGRATADHAGRVNPTVNRLQHLVFVRHRHNWVQLIRFGLVGGSGVGINMLVVIFFKRFGPDYQNALLALGGTGLHIRWYHAMVTMAFLVANFWNFVINRRWTFRSHGHATWYREYPPFLAVGAIGQLVNLGLVTALIHPDSAISLPGSVFDDSTGLRTKLYWAQLIAIGIVMPVSFMVNKLWTFSAVRHGRSINLIDPLEAEAEDGHQVAPGQTVDARPRSPTRNRI